jgi:O-methyltransferase
MDRDSFEEHRMIKCARNCFLGWTIISDQVDKDELGVVWRELEKVLTGSEAVLAKVPDFSRNHSGEMFERSESSSEGFLENAEPQTKQTTEGDVVEFGCYAGTTSLFIRRLLDRYKSEKVFHVYDSFDGLPEKGKQDVNAAGVDFRRGQLYVTRKEFMQNFKAANLRPPIVHKGWFNELTEKDVPDKIAFAFLDGDFYDSILAPLKLIWPRMTKSGVILIDDYNNTALPGVERAVNDFFDPKKLLRVEHSIGIIKSN